MPAAYFGSGIDFIGRPEGWGKEQREQWEAEHYHQPSDELRPDWDLTGAVEDVQLFFLPRARTWPTRRSMPRWNKGDEFEAPRLPGARRPEVRGAGVAPPSSAGGWAIWIRASRHSGC